MPPSGTMPMIAPKEPWEPAERKIMRLIKPVRVGNEGLMADVGCEVRVLGNFRRSNTKRKYNPDLAGDPDNDELWSVFVEFTGDPRNGRFCGKRTVIYGHQAIEIN